MLTGYKTSCRWSLSMLRITGCLMLHKRDFVSLTSCEIRATESFNTSKADMSHETLWGRWQNTTTCFRMLFQIHHWSQFRRSDPRFSIKQVSQRPVSSFTDGHVKQNTPKELSSHMLNTTKEIYESRADWKYMWYTISYFGGILLHVFRAWEFKNLLTPIKAYMSWWL